MILTNLGLIATLFIPSTQSIPHNEQSTTKDSPTIEVLVSEQSVKQVVAYVPTELEVQLRNRKVMPVSYWEDVAQCETRANERGWDDGGRFAGGLGIFIGTWQNYGGRQFARTPAKATKEEQITIANRISVFGYQTKSKFMTQDDVTNNRPWFQNPVSYFGWGCIKHNRYLHPEIWKKNNKTLTRRAPRQVK